MATALDVPWLEIRTAWENSQSSDAELAKKYGFGSKTTISRRRIAEGWKRDEVALVEGARQRAAQGTRLDVPDVVDVSADTLPDTSRTHGKSQQTLEVGAGSDVGVSIKMGTNSSPSRQSHEISHARGLAAAEEHTETKAAAQRRHILQAQELQSASLMVVRAVKAVFKGPPSGSYGDEDPAEDISTPYGQAVLSLRAINPDKDSASTLLKAAADALEKGTKLERLAIGMDDAAAAAGAGQGGAPSAIMSEAQLVEQLGAASFEALEALNDMALLTQQRRIPPTIDGKAEVVD